jgi:hypothetical protein
MDFPGNPQTRFSDPPRVRHGENDGARGTESHTGELALASSSPAKDRQHSLARESNCSVDQISANTDLQDVEGHLKQIQAREGTAKQKVTCESRKREDNT